MHQQLNLRVSGMSTGEASCLRRQTCTSWGTFTRERFLILRLSTCFEGAERDPICASSPQTDGCPRERKTQFPLGRVSLEIDLGHLHFFLYATISPALQETCFSQNQD